jgi:hypothetical protein
MNTIKKLNLILYHAFFPINYTQNKTKQTIAVLNWWLSVGMDSSE